MKTDLGLGGCSSIPEFVRGKLASFSEKPDFERLFDLMFREKDNIMIEKSRGFKIEKATYGEVKSAALRRAREMKETLAAVAPEGSAVGLYLENSREWIECFWAILAAGRRPLLLNLRLEDGILEKALREVGAKAVYARGKEFSVPTFGIGPAPDGEELASPVFGEEILVMSSGTGGSVKIAAYGAAEFEKQIEDSAEFIRLCPAVRTHVDGSLKLLTFLPFYHVFGLIAVYLWFGFFSRTFVELADLAPQTVLGTIRRHKVTHVFAVPLFWETVYREAKRAIAARGEKTGAKFEKGMRLVRKLDAFPRLQGAFSRRAFREVRENLFGESIRFMISGGSVLRREVLEFFNGIGYPLVEGYGMTETGITSVELSPRFSARCSGSVGAPVKNAAYKLDEKGELWVKGEVMARRVLENGVSADRPEWFPTHDLAECRDGRWYILGRRDDVIAAADGENLNPNLYESRLLGGGVREACLIGAEDGGAVTPVLLAAVSPFDRGEKLRAIDEELRRKLAEAGLATRVKKIAYLSGTLLKGDEFKVNRRRLEDEWEKGFLPLLSPDEKEEEAEDPALAEAKAFFAAALGRRADEIPAGADFFLDLGGTSLEYLAMQTKMREEWGVLAEGKTLTTAAAFAEERRKGGAG